MRRVGREFRRRNLLSIATLFLVMKYVANIVLSAGRSDTCHLSKGGHRGTETVLIRGVGRLTPLRTVGTHSVMTKDKVEQPFTVVVIKP